MTAETPIRVLLADDHAVMRRLLSEFIENYPGLALIGAAGDGLEAAELLSQCAVDVVLMDVRMPRLDGIEAARAIHRQWPRVPIIGLSVDQPGHPAHQEMVKAGAESVLAKAEQIHHIIPEIFRVAPRAQSSATTEAVGAD